MRRLIAASTRRVRRPPAHRRAGTAVQERHQDQPPGGGRRRDRRNHQRHRAHHRLDPGTVVEVPHPPHRGGMSTGGGAQRLPGGVRQRLARHLARLPARQPQEEHGALSAGCRRRPCLRAVEQRWGGGPRAVPLLAKGACPASPSRALRVGRAPAGAVAQTRSQTA
ncbi:hypothetical protein QJS66_03360 [Kocuria rhizophila]|nr:hypothetical protein QJS66_03360 [Kocuria rhizophila]